MKHRISPTTLIACLALFLSLGGVGLAASRASAPPTFQVQGTPVSLCASGSCSSAQPVTTCPQGHVVVSGAWSVNGSVDVSTSTPFWYETPDTGGRAAWLLHVTNTSDRAEKLYPRAVCQ